MPAELPSPEHVLPRFGPWQAVSFLGSGQFGSVFRVVRASSPHSTSFALKLAHFPDDPRFEREASVLSRLHHSHVPAFRDSGLWHSPSGHSYPFLVMQFAEGLSLYDWAEVHSLTSRAALRLLAQLARALEAAHALGVLHRDLKGDNIRVSHHGHLWLLDFGACSFPGAHPLTQGHIPPGTEPYRSPQIRLFRDLHQADKDAHYRFQPTDDVYALGVTAFRLETGAYPDDLEDVRAALACACPELRDLLLRMLSRDEHARGTASQLAQDMERAARTLDGRADLLLERLPPFRAEASFQQEASSDLLRPRASWLPTRWAAAALGLLGFLAGVWSARLDEQPPQVLSTQVGRDEMEGETQSLGEQALDSQPSQSKPPSTVRSITAAMPKKPLEGQRRPPCEAGHVEIHGGCWVAVHHVDEGTHMKAPCGESAFAHDGKCYMPSYPPPRKPTSEPR